MTKEEILINMGIVYISTRNILYMSECVPSEGVTDVLKAMDEYAKQQAIAFDVWKRENCITYDYENKAYSKLIFLDVDHTKVRTEQLSINDTYSQFIDNQFIEQQNKP